MTHSSHTDTDVVVARLATRVRRLQLTLGALAVICLAALLTGQALPSAVVVEAQKFVVRGADGEAVAWFGVDPESVPDGDRSPGLHLASGAGKVRASMFVDAETGMPHIRLRERGGEGGLEVLVTERGQTFLALRDNQGRNRIALQVAATGTPYLTLFDGNGRQTFSAP